jgi:hypothetical protein
MRKNFRFLCFHSSGADTYLNDLDDKFSVRLIKEEKQPKHTDWRLPTIKELLTLVNYGKCNNQVCAIQDVASCYYWSATNYSPNSDCSWTLNFYNGTTTFLRKRIENYVFFIRTAEDGSTEWSRTVNKKMTWHEAVGHAKNLKEKTYYKGN